MKTKTITVSTWTQDNAGSYHQPGSTLTIDSDGGDGCIGEDAAALVAKLDADRAALQPAPAADAGEPPAAE